MIPTHKSAFGFMFGTRGVGFEIFHSHNIFGVQPKPVWKTESSLIRALPKPLPGADFRRTITVAAFLMSLQLACVLIPQRKQQLSFGRPDETPAMERTISKGQKKSLRLWGAKRRESRRQTCEETASYEETRGDNDFFQRFDVTIVKTGGEGRQQQMLLAETQAGTLYEPTKNAARKQVRFHKFDHVLFPGGDTEYVYSLYDQEIEAESRRDFTNDIDDFFKRMKKKIQYASTGGNADASVGDESESIGSGSFSASASESLSTSTM